jgi:hypothetical protein
MIITATYCTVTQNQNIGEAPHILYLVQDGVKLLASHFIPFTPGKSLQFPLQRRLVKSNFVYV